MSFGDVCMRINLIINDACQLDCAHCCVKGKSKDHLSLDDWKKTYDKLVEVGDHIHLAGREPFINTNYTQFIQDNRFTYSAVTNGINLTPDLPDLDKFSRIAVSWDPYHAQQFPSYDFGSVPLGASITLTNENLNDVLDGLWTLNVEHNVFDAYIAPVIPLTPSVIPDQVPPRMYRAFYDILIERLQNGTYKGSYILDIKGPYLDHFRDLPVMTSYPNGWCTLERETHCRACIHEITVCPDGTVIPCFFCYTPEYQSYSLGKLPHDEINTILMRGLQTYRNWNINTAKQCAYDNGCNQCRQKCPLWVVTCMGRC